MPFKGHPSWGIAWYLNDLLIPEVYVERGQTYTFLVEGGNDETQPARYVLNLLYLIITIEFFFVYVLRYHPFYISDSDEGGYGQKSQQKQSRQTVYAGVKFEADDYPRPTAGLFCLANLEKKLSNSKYFQLEDIVNGSI